MGLILVIARKRPNLIPTRLHSECPRAARAACRHTATCATVPNFEQHHSFGAAGLAHSDPREAQTRNLGGPLPSTAATIPQKDPQEREERAKLATGGKERHKGTARTAPHQKENLHTMKPALTHTLKPTKITEKIWNHAHTHQSRFWPKSVRAKVGRTTKT